MIGLALAMALGGASVSAEEARYIRTHYPADIRPLITRATALSGDFVNAPETAQTRQARRQYETVSQQLKAKGWCWGSTNPDAVGADLVWVPCRLNRYGQ